MTQRSWARLGPGFNEQKLEVILRHFFEFREIYEQTGKDEIIVGETTVNIHDMLRGVRELPKRQREALVLTVIYNLKEDEASRFMGLSQGNSTVGGYKKLALKKLMPLWVPPPYQIVCWDDQNEEEIHYSASDLKEVIEKALAIADEGPFYVRRWDVEKDTWSSQTLQGEPLDRLVYTVVWELIEAAEAEAEAITEAEAAEAVDGE